MIGSMFNNQSSPSLSLEDLTSLSSISSSESTSLFSSNHPTISNCNESHNHQKTSNKSLSQFSSSSSSTSSLSSCSSASLQESQSASSLSVLINQRIRQKMKMLNIQPYNFRKSYKKVTFISEPNIGKVYKDVETSKGIIRNESFPHGNCPIQSMEKTEKKTTSSNQIKAHPINSRSDKSESIPVEELEVSSISSIEIAPSTIEQFKYMIGKQKDYLDCLQRELSRIQRMETVLTELHYNSELQKRVINGLVSSSCHKNFDNCSPQSSSKYDESLLNETFLSQNVNSNPKPSKSDSLDGYSEHLSEISTLESEVFDVVPATDKKSYMTCSKGNSASVNQMAAKKSAIDSINATIDKMIYKAHEEIVTKHSIGVQTSEPDKSYHQFQPEVNIKASNGKFSGQPKTRDSYSRYRERRDSWKTSSSEENLFKKSTKNTNKGEAYYLIEDGPAAEMSLQQAFRSRCRDFMVRSQSRVREINIASRIRKATAECRLERQLEEFLLRNQQIPRYDYDTISGYQSNHPKVKIIRPKKIFTEKEMRQQTERLYCHLPEIKKSQEAKRRQENCKTYRLMARNFSQKLKNSAVEGKVTFPLTQRLTNY